jgi:serine protease AprX
MQSRRRQRKVSKRQNNNLEIFRLNRKGAKVRENLFVVFFNVVILSLSICIAAEPVSDINAKVAQLDIKTANLDKVISIFGEPEKYIGGNSGDKTFERKNLPSNYVAVYPGGLYIMIVNDHIIELRFYQPGYIFRDKIQVGASLEEVLEVVGQPVETVVNQKNEDKDGVLYKDVDGYKGKCYYGRSDQNVKFFFNNYKVAALYVTSQMHQKGNSFVSRGHSFDSVKEFNNVKAFDNVRWGDLSKLDFSNQKGLLPTLTFNKDTIWPQSSKMPADYDPNKLLTDAMNSGLGIRELHKEGITGKGVNVAIIDQPLFGDHPEYAGKIKDYHDVGCGSAASMHGPAVASLLVGTNCGTAPDARLYYVAAPSWTKDAAYQAQALDWIIEQNEKLPAGEKIRLVSVSGAPSGPNSPFDKNNQMWDEACLRAEAAGILVLDCTSHHGFIGPCWYDANDPENVARCNRGYPGMEMGAMPGKILVPASPRTTAEEYEKGKFGYQYCGRGGLSWSIPYAGGVLALGWQIRPELTPAQMRELLFQSAYVDKNQAKIINPKEFIRLVKNFKSP